MRSILGQASQPILAYNSNGLGLIPPEAAADEAEALLEDGFTGVKLRLGRTNFELDLAAVRAVRRRVQRREADGRFQSGTYVFGRDAIPLTHSIDEGIYWIEEPIRHDDYRHMAQIDASRDERLFRSGRTLPGWLRWRQLLEAGSSDYVMLDLDRIGGMTGWQRAWARLGVNREVSSHLFPEVSAHLLAATSGRHWLEYVDWAESDPAGAATDQERLGNALLTAQATGSLGTPMSLRNTG